MTAIVRVFFELLLGARVNVLSYGFVLDDYVDTLLR